MRFFLEGMLYQWFIEVALADHVQSFPCEFAGRRFGDASARRGR
jgi:hypothetical protein